ncbi:MAG TPA: outer membrane protein assembly factor BamC [Gammaproteobacteria bacterium]|nr:outer membrane protein assembly factor BamC [Gammaproteobacteria bacterium]
MELSKRQLTWPVLCRSAIVLSVVLLSACGTLSNTPKIDYRSSRTLPPLEVPPDLSAPETGPLLATSAINSAGKAAATTHLPATVIPDFPDVAVRTDGTEYWLEVKATPDQVWNKVIQFWAKEGISLVKSDKTLGIVETDWLENIALLGGKFERSLRKILGSVITTGKKDKYRTRLEKGLQPGTTEIYLTHQGMVEVVLPGKTPTEVESSVWQPAPPDHSLEAEMLKRLLVFLGTPEQRAVSKIAAAKPDQPVVSIQKAQNQQIGSIQLAENFERSWRHVGLALDRLGFTVVDRNRQKGVYYIRYIDPESIKAQKDSSFFSKFFSKKPATVEGSYRIQLTISGKNTLVHVIGDGTQADSKKTAQRIYKLLAEKLQ